LSSFWRHLKRRDIYAGRLHPVAPTRRARLLEGEAWKSIRSDVLAAPRLARQPRRALLAEHARTLDAAYREVGGAGFGPSNAEVSID